MKHVFLVHVPRAAGNSIKSYMVNDLAKMNVETMGQIDPPVNVMDKFWFHCHGHQRVAHVPVSPKYYFTFLRSPWDRLVSAWTYLRNTGTPHLFEDAKKFINHHETFEAFVSDFYQRPAFYFKQKHLAPQFYYLMDGYGTMYVDFIGTVENMNRDFKCLCSILDIPFKYLPVLNVSEHAPISDYYTPATWKMVESIYAEDLKLISENGGNHGN
jgi:hypothetical protein